MEFDSQENELNFFTYYDSQSDVLTRPTRRKALSWVLRGSGTLIWIAAAAALYSKLYEKPFFGWDQGRLDTLSAILFLLPPILFWLSGTLKPRAPDTDRLPLVSATAEGRLRRDLIRRVKASLATDEIGETSSGRGQPDVLHKIEQLRNMALIARNRRQPPLPPGTKIIDVFDQVQPLLILGPPGAGKTTALLELTWSALARAEQDALSPIPVVFSLSSWSKRWDSFEDWLTAQLTLTQPYNVPKKYASSLLTARTYYSCSTAWTRSWRAGAKDALEP